ncbi:exported hypothetical protein [Candidatus Zixiibacteriota bacterium]|nr:exported hypothetical protein [candidate division Zixibacteria bacterium]
MRKTLTILFALSFLIVSAGWGVTFRAAISGDSVWNDGGALKISPESEFRIEVYATNNDTIMPPPYVQRVSWSSPFAFTGNVKIQWLDTISNDTLYSDLATLSKFSTTQFADFWDIFKGVYAESRDGILPDRFDIIGVANKLGYPPGLGEIPIVFWRAKVISDTGQICIEQGNMRNDSYDWIFDEPKPKFATVCWKVERNPSPDKKGEPPK